MLVLDYVREMTWEDPLLEIPAFHRGHLGFLSGTSVNVGLLPIADDGAPYPEVVIGQYVTQGSGAVRLSATLREDTGVVARLLREISQLNINVELQESNSINQFREHHVNLVLGLGSYLQEAEGQAVSDRLAELSEHLAINCGDILVWRQWHGFPDPAIQITPMPSRHFDTPPSNSTVVRTNSKMSVCLPDNISTRLRGQMVRGGEPDSNVVRYLYVSDTSQRNLRAFFLPGSVAPKLFHVGFHHANVPGALATILDLVKSTNFNILTSLLRRETASRSVWEAVLEYKGASILDWKQTVPKEGDPAISMNRSKLNWLKSVLDSHVSGSWSGSVAGTDPSLTISAPKYPVRKSSKSKALDEVRVGAEWTYVRRTPPEEDLASVIESQLARVDVLPASERPIFDDYLRRAKLKNTREKVRRVFISFPANAEKHANYLKECLKAEGYKCSDYGSSDGEYIVDEVQRRIRDCDALIGIWHHEPHQLLNGDHIVSPWMPFEYGIAKNIGVHTTMAASKLLPEHIWKRIEPGVSHFRYDDVDFVTHVVPKLLEHCRVHVPLPTDSRESID